jgi:hypothetical protein
MTARGMVFTRFYIRAATPYAGSISNSYITSVR